MRWAVDGAVAAAKVMIMGSGIVRVEETRP